MVTPNVEIGSLIEVMNRISFFQFLQLYRYIQVISGGLELLNLSNLILRSNKKVSIKYLAIALD